MKRSWRNSISMLLLLGCIHETALSQQSLDFLFNPYPETGAWDAKDSSRTGFFMEVQNGIMAGAYFGADAAGDNVWLIFSGQLQPVIGDDGLQNGWLLESPLRQTTAAGCILNCAEADMVDPVTDEVAQITLTFSGRSQATFSIDDSEPTNIYPAYWGNPAFAFDPEQPNLFLPNLTGTWVGVSTMQGRFDAFDSDIFIMEIGERQVTNFPDAADEEAFLEVLYPIIKGSFSGLDILCRYFRNIDTASLCLVPISMDIAGIRINDISDSRFTWLVSDDTLTLTRTDFFRLNYD
ncbi:MAG: hypothetical protein KKC01_06685 [Gammaproteobacteria bacterium]|nr:hypothetical protein [Gammaproteobacteria bacterium]